MRKSIEFLTGLDAEPKPDYTDPQVLRTMVHKNFNDVSKGIKGIKRRKTEYYDLLDYDKPRLRKRIDAVLATMEQVRGRLAQHCPNIPGVFSIEEDWAKVNATPITSPDIQESHSDFTAGAAIWILDAIREAGKMDELLRLLPSDPELLDEVIMPDIWDACYSRRVIAGVLYVIRQRNQDCLAAPKKKGKKQEVPHSARVFMDRCTTAGTHRQETASRQRFEAVLALIPVPRIKVAVERYEKKLWEWTALYYRCRNIYAQREEKLTKSFQRFSKRANQVALEQKNALERVCAAPAVLQKGPDPAELAGGVKGIVNFLYKMPFSRERFGNADGFVQTVHSLGDEMTRLDNQADNLSDEVNDFVFDSISNCAETKNNLEESYGAEIAEILSSFECGSPYDLCFAQLFLVDRESVLPWLYFPACNLMEHVGCRLPWTCGLFDEDEEADETERMMMGIRRRRRGRRPELPDWYRLEYQNRNEDFLYRKRTNLAQIVYSITGSLMPRRLSRFEYSLNELADYGITGRDAVGLVQCIALMSEVRRQVTLDSETEGMLEDGSEESQTPDPASMPASTPATEESAEERIAKLQEALTALKQENGKLKRIAHSAAKEAADERQRYETLSEQTRLERKELAELREVIFYQQAESEPAADASIEYPYEVKRRTVVFGGHDSWARAIKPMLRGDIRFIGRNMIPNADLIRHADLVWLQTNSLSHKFYNKIMDVVRNYGVPVHYFKFASAEKCAEQVVLEDQET